ncbi:hypothetical protein ACS0TY_031344 [Phlomoides rotata]
MKMVEATEDQWAPFMMKDSNSRLMRHKSWPLYEDWCKIFGQSRAMGQGAESHVNVTTPPLLSMLMSTLIMGRTRWSTRIKMKVNLIVVMLKLVKAAIWRK